MERDGAAAAAGLPGATYTTSAKKSCAAKRPECRLDNGC